MIDTEPGICFLCGRHGYTECHHIMNGIANRKKATEDNLVVFLCYHCHHERIHGTDKEARLYLKRLAQRTWMDENHAGTRAFVERYGKNYLEEWE